jgi:glycosyltransferase involved in cell wall biosynthesis
MALQGELLERLLREDGHQVWYFPSNFPAPALLRWLNQVPVARTVLRFVLIWPKLFVALRRAQVAHVLAASWLYFFVVVAPAVIMGRVLGKRVVLNYRGGDARRFFQRYGMFVKPIFKLATVVVTPSTFLADMIRELFQLPSVIVRNILDTSAFQYRQRTSFQPRILVARQLEPIYDVETALRAFRKVQELRPDASLWIAGSGSEEARLRQLVAEWGLNNVRFLGHVPHSTLPALHDQCDILLNSSRVDNFPASLLEASAAGLAIVSTGAGGIPFLYEHGATAFLASVGDGEALARGIEQVLQDGTAATRMTARSAAMAQSCRWSEVRELLYQTYGLRAKIPRQPPPREEACAGSNVIRDTVGQNSGAL